MRRLPLCLAALLVISPALRAESQLSIKLAALKSAMVDEVRGRRNPQTADQYPPSLALANNRMPSFATLSRLYYSEHGGQLFDDPREVIKQILAEYTGAATQKAAREALDAAENQRLSALTADQHKFQSDLERLKNLIGTAKQPADMDGLLADFGHFQSRSKEGTSPPEMLSIVRADIEARYCAIGWQAYLFHKAHGQVIEAQRDLSFVEEKSGLADTAFKAEIA